MSEDLLGRARTLTEALHSRVQLEGDRESLIVLDRERGELPLTLAEFWKRARTVQSALVARGLTPGTVVVLVLPTSPELLTAYFGIVLAGGIPAMLSMPSHRVSDPRIFTARVGHVVATSKPHSIICRTDVAALFTGEEAAALGDAQLLTPADVESSDGLLEPFACGPETLATNQYSSGTTGAPKGVLVTHRAALNNLRSMREGFAVTERDIAVNWIPLYHDMGLFGAFLLPLLSGCKTVLIPTMDFMRDPGGWLRAIDHYRGTFAFGPNLAYALCAKRLSDKALEGLDLSTWRLALNASEAVLEPTLKAFESRMAKYGFSPENMSPSYGLAEATLLATAHPIDEPPRYEVLDRQVLAAEDIARPTEGQGVSCVSVGRALPDNEIEIRDAEGRVLSERQIGKVWLRSNALFWGYHQNPELTSRVLVDGWLDTGDRGYLVDGYLFFISRDKDVIIIGGEKYVPDDIEAAINRVPGVRLGCAVAFGVINEERGTEDLAAVVETRETEPEALHALRRGIRNEVTAATGLGLAHVLLVPPGGVEKSTSGKLSRGPTRRRYAGELGVGS